MFTAREEWQMLTFKFFSSSGQIVQSCLCQQHTIIVLFFANSYQLLFTLNKQSQKLQPALNQGKLSKFYLSIILCFFFPSQLKVRQGEYLCTQPVWIEQYLQKSNEQGRCEQLILCNFYKKVLWSYNSILMWYYDPEFKHDSI